MPHLYQLEVWLARTLFYELWLTHRSALRTISEDSESTVAVKFWKAGNDPLPDLLLRMKVGKHWADEWNKSSLCLLLSSLELLRQWSQLRSDEALVAYSLWCKLEVLRSLVSLYLIFRNLYFIWVLRVNILDLIVTCEAKTLPYLSQIVVHLFLDCIWLVLCSVIDFVKSLHWLRYFLELTHLMPLYECFELTNCIIYVWEKTLIFSLASLTTVLLCQLRVSY